MLPRTNTVALRDPSGIQTDPKPSFWTATPQFGFTLFANLVTNKLWAPMDPLSHATNPPPCLPAQHGVLFFVQFVLAGTSSGTSADVREPERAERDDHLSPAGVCQRSLKMWLCGMTILLCSMRWPHSQPLLIMFHADLSYYRTGNVQKRTAPRKLPSQAVPIALVWQLHSVV